MALTFRSLNAVSVPTVGANFNVDKPSQFTWQFFTTGDPIDVEGTIDVSIDGVTFSTVFSGSFSANGPVRLQPGFFVSVRATVTSITGGTSPTATVWFSASD